MKKNCFLLLFCLILTAVGCTNEEYNDNVIVFAPDSLLIDGRGEIRTLDFLSSGTASCEVTSPDEWMALHAETIGRITSYELVVSGNPGGEKRYGTLVITQRGARKRVKVVQQVAETEPAFLSVGEVSAALPNVGGRASLRIESNAEWVVTIDKDWLTLKDNMEQGQGYAIVDLVATQNEEVGVKRTAQITVALKDDPHTAHTVVAVQDCHAPVFRLSESALTFNKSKGNAALLTIQSTWNWALKDVPVWLEADRTEASGFMQSDRITFTTTEVNASGEERSGQITVCCGEEILGTITVMQRADQIELFPLSAENIRVSTYQQGDGSIENMFDNDPNTYFTTYWNSYYVTVPQWITVDLGDEAAVDKLAFWYTARNKLDYVPSKVLIQVTEDAPGDHIWQKEGDAYTDADRNWKTLATYEGDEWCPVEAGAESGMLVAEADKDYRYWRFYVAAAKQNPRYEAEWPDAFCFQLSELKVYLYK